MRNVLVAALLTSSYGCGGGVPIASPTPSHQRPDYVPPPPDNSARATTGIAEVPPSTDPAERLVFTRAGSIAIMKPDGSDLSRVTIRAASAPDETPALSPRGTEVVFASARDGVRKLYVATVDGAETRPITDGADGGDAHPTWTPDGKSVLFVRGRPETRRDLYLVPAGGGTPPRRLLEGRDDAPAQGGWPAVSPDGRTIVFVADRGEGTGTSLFLVGIDGKGIRRLTRPPQSLSWVVDTRPAWSPDGKRIAFASNRHGTSSDDAADFDIYAIDPDAGAVVRLTNDPAVADDPVYSPDGKRIYFTTTRDATRAYSTELYVMPAGGGEQDRLTRDETPQNAAPSAGRIK